MHTREAAIIACHLFAGGRQGRDPPALAAFFDGLTNLRVQHVEEFDPMLRNALLQPFVGLVGQTHILRVGPDQRDLSIVDDQVHAPPPRKGSLLFGERGHLVLLPPFFQPIQVEGPLRKVDAGQRDESARGGKQGCNAGFQLPVAGPSEDVVAEGEKSRHSVPSFPWAYKRAQIFRPPPCMLP